MHRAGSELGCDVGGSAAYEFIAIGKATFIRGDLLGVASVGSEKWTKYSDEEGLGATFTPQQLLSTLRAASEETRRIGEEDVRGVETVRYQLEVDCDQEDLVHCDGETAPVDVWVGADGLVRRISIDDRSVSATIEFYDFGADVDVEAPPADQVQDLDVLGNPRPCSDTQGDPISVGRTLGALRANGFEVEEPDCATLIATFGATSVSGNGGTFVLPVRGATWRRAHDAPPPRRRPCGRRADAAESHLCNLRRQPEGRGEDRPARSGVRRARAPDPPVGSRHELASRRREARARTRAHGTAQELDALVVRAPDDVLYLTNFWGMKGYDACVFPREGEPS